MVPAGGVPVEADEDGADDGDDVADVVEAVAAAPEPPVDASATPVAPAPTPAATMPVRTSRRVRLPVMEVIRLPPFTTAAAGCDRLVWGRACATGLAGSRGGLLRMLWIHTAPQSWRRIRHSRLCRIFRDHETPHQGGIGRAWLAVIIRFFRLPGPARSRPGGEQQLRVRPGRRQDGDAVPPIPASGWRTRSPEPSRRPTGGGSSTGVPAAVAPRAGPGPAQASTSMSSPRRKR
jgi:hypothetical protein